MHIHAYLGKIRVEYIKKCNQKRTLFMIQKRRKPELLMLFVKSSLAN